MLERTRAPSCWGLSRGLVRGSVAAEEEEEEEVMEEGSGAGCEMMPMPSLLAEPSQPRARRRRFLGGLLREGDIFVCMFVLFQLVVVVGG